MLSHLSNKITLILLLVLLLTIGTNSWLTNMIFVNEYTGALTAEALVIGESLKLQLDRLLALEIPLEDIMGFDEQCREITTKYRTVSYASVVNTEGQILFHNDRSQHKTTLSAPELREAIKRKKETVVQYRYGDEGYYGFVIPVFNTAGSHVGAVVLGFPVKVISQKTAFYIWVSILVSAVFFAFSFILITYALTKWVTNPLIKLDKFAHQLGEKGIGSSPVVNINTHDEIGRLARSFNKMAVDLEKTTVSKDFMDNIISSMMDALIVIDSKLTIKTINNATSVLLNYPPDELLESPVATIFRCREESPFQGETLAKIISEGSFKNYETTLLKKNGEIVPVLLSCSVMKDENSQVKYIVCTSKDITERKQAEESLLAQTEQLTRYNAELQEFAYAASHDLQEPLRKIMAFSDRIIQKNATKFDEQSLDYFQRIQNACTRMQTLITSLLNYSRVTTQAQPFVKIKLNQIAGEVVTDLEARIEQTGGKVEIAGLPEIEADPTQMRQLFQNLIANGLKYHRPGIAPLIKIYATKTQAEPGKSKYRKSANEFYEITFEDNGIGIDKQNLTRIFGVFQRLHGKHEYEGTGVGLAICQKIIERHRGQIKVESKPGEGSKFIVILPAKQNSSE